MRRGIAGRGKRIPRGRSSASHTKTETASGHRRKFGSPPDSGQTAGRRSSGHRCLPKFATKQRSRGKRLPTRGNPSFGWRAGATGAERKAVRQIPKIGNRPRRSHSVRGGIVKRRLVGEPRPVELAGVEPASKQGARRLSTRLAAIRSFFPFTAGGSLARDPASSFRPPAEASGGLSLKR